MSADRKRLRVLRDAARHLADGEPVDWRGIRERDARLGDSLEGLRVVEAVVAIHRTPLPEERLLEETGPPEPPASRPVPPGELRSWGRLQVGALLGAGSFGEVYRAHDPALRKDVALKLLRPVRGAASDLPDRFLVEARRLARVSHENVLVVHGADRHDDRVGLWTDLIEGHTLEDHLQAHGNLSAAEAAVVGQHLCRALAAVHGAGLVHRDVKTRNIMRRRSDGQIILMDFSAAAQRASWSDAFSNEPIAGTPPFLAPEVLRGEDAGVAADIYSLGVVLYRLVTGAFPVEASSLAELCEKHRRREIVPLLDRKPELDERFIQVVEKALDPDPARRYASMGEMERDLKSVLILPDADPDPPWRAAIWGTAAAAVVALAFAAWAFITALAPPLRVTVDLVRHAGEREERLPAGATVYPGDLISIEVQGSAKMHVYAVNVNPSGEAIALFPEPDVELSNPLDAGMVHRLSGTDKGRPSYWKMSRQRGIESFYVFASPYPLPEAARLVARSVPSSAPPVPSEEDRGPVRGISGRASPGPVPRRPRDAESARLLEILLERSARDVKVRAWQMSVENQG